MKQSKTNLVPLFVTLSVKVWKNKAALDTLINVVLLLLHFFKCAFQTSDYTINKHLHVHVTPLNPY